jgi:hypothetical protein
MGSLLRRTFVAATMLSVVDGSMAAEILCDSEYAFFQSGLSAHKSCISEHYPDFADYETWLPDCKLVVYLTNLANKQEIGQSLQQAYSQILQRNSIVQCPPSREPLVEFRKADYAFAQMLAWHAVLKDKVRDIESGHVTKVSFSDGKLHLYTQTDAAMVEVIDALEDTGVPQDAYSIGSREADVRKEPSITPTTRMGTEDEEVVLPVYFWSKEKVGDVILGQTKLDEATKMLPPWPGHGPSDHFRSTPRSERPSWASDEIHSVIDSLQFGYTPARTFVFLGFDGAKRLVMASYEVQKLQADKLLQELLALHPVEEIHRSERTLIRRTQIGSCTTVELVALRGMSESYELKSTIYFFTCTPGHKI